MHVSIIEQQLAHDDFGILAASHLVDLFQMKCLEECMTKKSFKV